MITKESPLKGMSIGVDSTIAIRELPGLQTMDLRVAPGTLSHAAITQVLDICFRNQPLSYSIINNNIVVVKEAVVAAPPQIVAVEKPVMLKVRLFFHLQYNVRMAQKAIMASAFPISQRMNGEENLINFTDVNPVNLFLN